MIEPPTKPTQTSPDAVTMHAGIGGVCAQCGCTVGDPLHPCPKCGAAVSGGGPLAAQNDRMRARLQESIGDGYKLLELLGRGGMGIVYRAREVALDRDVALKVLALDPILAPDAYTRFEREAKLAARLDHPHIVPIFAVGQRQNVAFYTMRLVRGGNLEELISDRKQLALDHVVKLLKEVAAALDHAHRQGVVHRDIKPANVLLGESGHAMVADFGIAKALSNTESGATGTGIIGSPGYMSPEQWRGAEIDGRADQYSLGIVAFEMLAGKRPFETPQVQDLLRMHLSAEVPPLSHFRGGLPQGVDEALRRALAKDPSQRFSTVGAFVDALAGLRPASAGITQRGPRYAAKAAPPPKRGLVGALVPIILIAGVGAAFAFPQTRDPMMSALQPAILSIEGLAGVRDAGPEKPDSLAIRDSIALAAQLAAHDSLVAAMAATTAPAPGTGGDTLALHDSTARAQLSPVPMMLDTTLAAMAAARNAPRMQYGWLRVVINGGTAPAKIDGVRQGSTPIVRRVEEGEHLVTVEGAGDSFLPSQITVTVAAGDTASAVFTTPEAMRRAKAPRPVPDSASRPGDPAGPGAADSAATTATRAPR
ncbi:MAG TPA: serine/threonine-protein kinase [Gemmatimonadaceae bacterium]|nr:serine/threonine-protein kinase [Gemmatimonadaceae bacterium]